MILLFLIFSSCQHEELLLINVDNYDVSSEQVSSIALKFTNTETFITSSQPNDTLLELSKESSVSNSKRKVIGKIIAIADSSNSPVFYVVLFKPMGFVIISATKKEIPILAYSESNNFDINDMPYGLQMWMNYRKERIIFLKSSTASVPPAIINEWDRYVDSPNYIDPETGLPGPVPNPNAGDYIITKGPLTQTTWGQGYGYNSMLTPINGQLPPTGCLATAMAQVMKYHQFPKSYNWTLMPNNYGTSETAKLMKDIGKAVGMSYDLSGSSADTENEAAESFISNFGYSSSAYYISDYLSNYDKIVSEIDASRPVILRGGRKKYWAGLIPYYGDGHAWVCDGYRKSRIGGYGYLSFCMNWGWNGSNNGFYSFDNFNPSSYTFNYKVGIVVGIKP